MPFKFGHIDELTGRNTLSDAQWSAPLGRATEASAGTVHENMETPLSDAQWFVPLGRATEVSAVMVRNCFLDLFLRMTEASRERSVFGFYYDFLVWVGRCFLDLVLRMAEASRETLRFWFLA